MKYLQHHAAVLMAIAVSFPVTAAEPEKDQIYTISVTATREERATKEVPASIAVIDEERVDDSRMFNITDALSGVPGVQINTKNGGYDARLIIRGAGLKARYGIREIMMLRDGVPLTDPDSFTRLDFIDTQDIERVEVTKGPGNIYALGSAGGTIQIISKSVFDEGNNVKVGIGDDNSQNVHARITSTIGTDEDQAVSFTFSKRKIDNDWRRNWNKFDSEQLSVKHGYDLGNDSVLETELSYTKSDLQLPGSMDQTQYDEFKRTGKQTGNDSAWKHSGRYSTNWFFNTRLEKKMGDITYKPRFYANVWSHLHPVTTGINDTNDVTIIGTDQEFSYKHQLLGDSTLVAGLTLKQDRNTDDKKYQYRDYTINPFSGRIEATLSDAKGALMETSSETNNVIGIFAQESMRPNKDWLVDVGFRFDKINLKQSTNEISFYDWSTGLYDSNGGGVSHRDTTFDLFSANVGASYKLNDKINAFFTLAQGDQVPFSSELDSNPDLNVATSRNHELGFKGRAKNWEFDTSLYLINTTDEVIATLVGRQTLYQNAGETEKKGLEFSGSYQLLDAKSANELWLGTSYAYSDYKYKAFNEIVGAFPKVEEDRSGNQLPFIPEHQYSVFLTYKHTSGIKARLQSDTWGEYYMDSANTEKHEGYQFITSLNVSYETGPHTVSANIQNLTDERYAVEVKKDTGGNISYTPGAPRSFLLSYRYKF